MPIDPPPPVTDLDWSPERASAFGTRVLDLYTSLHAELPDAPTSPQLTTAGVRYRTEARHLEQLLELTREIGERVHTSGVVS